MPVDSRHPDYSSKITRWQKNRDAFAGEDAVKVGGSIYLPRPGGFIDSEFDAFVMRASWYGATRRTVQGLTGAVFQKDPIIEASPQVDPHLDNITLTSISATQFALRVLSEVELIGRTGILLDYNSELRQPYWSGIPAENIINWHVTYVQGLPTLTLVVIREESDEMSDGYEVERKTRYRVCRINDDGIYEVTVYEEFMNIQTRSVDMMRVESYIPTRRLRTLDFIPFLFVSCEDLTPNVCDGPLDDMVDKNFSYFRHSANYEHGLFLTGCPTPVITGHNLNEGERVPIGSLAAWVFPNPEAKAYLLEYQGQGLQSHERAMAQDKQEMATLGARLLEETPATQETLGAVQIRHSGESGNLKTLANLVSQGLTKILRWHHWWHGVTEDLEDERFSFTLNTDFSTTRLTPQEMQALMQLWQSGAISQQTLFWNLKQGELVPDDVEFEDEQSLIELEAPARIPFGEPEPEPEPENEPEPEPEENAA